MVSEDTLTRRRCRRNDKVDVKWNAECWMAHQKHEPEKRLCKRSRFTASLLDTIVTRRRSSFRERESSTLSLISAKTATLRMK